LSHPMAEAADLVHRQESKMRRIGDDWLVGNERLTSDHIGNALFCSVRK